jgi:hypothetical protein
MNEEEMVQTNRETPHRDSERACSRERGKWVL